ncbi:hypothetical protein [Nonomuraea sp. GTA35]|uniref:hypothetical protein n=1 Tax=Nonomuraea sp. GTA35 TaxID=1676746 RepID=UPI0035C06FCB
MCHDHGRHRCAAPDRPAAAGAPRVPVTGAYPLERAPEAFASFGAGALGKLAVTCS